MKEITFIIDNSVHDYIKEFNERIASAVQKYTNYQFTPQMRSSIEKTIYKLFEKEVALHKIRKYEFHVYQDGVARWDMTIAYIPVGYEDWITMIMNFELKEVSDVERKYKKYRRKSTNFKVRHAV